MFGSWLPPVLELLRMGAGSTAPSVVPDEGRVIKNLGTRNLIIVVVGRSTVIRGASSNRQTIIRSPLRDVVVRDGGRSTIIRTTRTEEGDHVN